MIAAHSLLLVTLVGLGPWGVPAEEHQSEEHHSEKPQSEEPQSEKHQSEVPGSRASAHLVIHGGAGTQLREEMTAELEAEYRSLLAEALRLGHATLSEGGSSLDAIERTIRFLEDSPRFNAGRGSVFTAEGRNEMDASIMDGSTRNAGAVAGVTRLRHPISAARAVMERSEHVMLSGPGAEAFAEAQGLETASPDFFWTESRWDSLQERRRREGELPLARPPTVPPAVPPTVPPTVPPAAPPSVPTTPPQPHDPPEAAVDAREGRLDDETAKFGTVGAVAVDAAGRIAAGTSTGGMTYKRHGRVGDSPIIGAGTYADDLCGVSATGHGEYFIRWAVAHEICALMHHRGLSARDAAERVVHDTLKPAGGSGGVIVLSRGGEPALVFNTPGMYRGWIGADGVPHVAIFEDESPDGR